jgi:hypothetical protein
MGLWTDNALATSTGTGTTNTQVNAAQSLATPTQAKVIKEITPYSFPATAYTAAESNKQRVTVLSNSIGTIQPKAIAMTPSHGGLGTFAGVQIPMLNSYRMDTILPNANTPIDYYGQSYTANTAAFLVGVTVTYSDEITMQMPRAGVPAKPIPEQFYDCPTGDTATGTATGLVAGSTITVNNGTALNLAYGNFGVGTVAASDSMAGFLQVDSTDLLTIQRVRAALQPIGTGLGTAVEVLQANGKFYPQALPLRNTAILNTNVYMEQALANAGRFLVGVGYIRA